MHLLSLSRFWPFLRQFKAQLNFRAASEAHKVDESAPLLCLRKTGALSGGVLSATDEHAPMRAGSNLYRIDKTRKQMIDLVATSGQAKLGLQIGRCFVSR